jgi:hypothetical protein
VFDKNSTVNKDSFIWEKIRTIGAVVIAIDGDLCTGLGRRKFAKSSCRVVNSFVGSGMKITKRNIEVHTEVTEVKEEVHMRERCSLTTYFVEWSNLQTSSVSRLELSTESLTLCSLAHFALSES